MADNSDAMKANRKSIRPMEGMELKSIRWCAAQI
jgi:hypothetical protein